MKDRKNPKDETRADYLGETLFSIFDPKGLGAALDEINKDFRRLARQEISGELKTETEQEEPQD